MHLLASAEAARDQERIHRGAVLEAVIGQYGEARLGLDRPQRIGDQKRVDFRIKTARDREHPMRAGEVHDLGVLEDVDAKSESGSVWLGRGHGSHS
jgi:hypothetical protein